MPGVAWSGALALMLVAQLIHTQACRPTQPREDVTPTPAPSPAPSPTPSPAPAADTIVTRDGVRFRTEVVASRLVIPWALAFAPDGRLFFTERPGRVRILNVSTGSIDTALTLDDVSTRGEAGLLGIAIDPDFAQNRRGYIYYTASVSGGGAVNRIVRCREVGGLLGERAVLLDNIPAASIHDGGRLRFGPDRLLYATAGDAANTGLPPELASYAGKILRIATDGSTPRDNPYSSPIYSYGHRNPQGIDWHPVTGDLWASEHGNAGNDEINVIQSGGNYGWPRSEGGIVQGGTIGPVTHYVPAIAPSGASFYRGRVFPQFANDLFVGALRGTMLLRVRVDSSRRIEFQERLLEDRFGRIRDVITGPDGYLYFCTSNRDGRATPDTTDDRIVRLVPVS